MVVFHTDVVGFHSSGHGDGFNGSSDDGALHIALDCWCLVLEASSEVSALLDQASLPTELERTSSFESTLM